MATTQSTSTATDESFPYVLPDLDGLLKGKRVCIVGRFSYYPAKDALREFVRQHGGTVTDTVDEKLDLMLVGEGRKPAKQAQAEKLNRAGKATIEIIDDLSQLVPGLHADIPKYLADPTKIASMAELVGLGWVTRNVDLTQQQVDFSEAVLGSDKKVELGLCFENCGFTKATLKNVRLSRRGYCSTAMVHGCTFDKTTFDDFDVWEFSECSFTDVRGKLLDLGDATNCTMTGAKLDELQIRDLIGSEITACQFKTLRSGLTEIEARNSRIEQTKVGSFRSPRLDAKDCHLSDLNVGQWEVDSFVLEKTKLVSCTFSNGKAEEVKLIACDLVDCTFNGLECDSLDLSGSNLTNVVFKKSKIGALVATEEQLAHIRGLSDQKIIDAKGFPKVNQLAKTFQQSNKLRFEILGTFDNDKKVKLVVNRDWGADYSFEGVGKAKSHQGKQELRGYQRKATAQDHFRQLHWLVSASRVEDIDLKTLTVKTSKCPLKPKEIKQLISDAVYEAMGKEPPTEEELKKATAAARKQQSDAKAAIVAELKAADVKALNKRTEASIRDAGPFRKLDLSNLKLARLKAKDVNFGACDFSKATLSRAVLSGGSFTKAKFCEADLEGADLSDASLKEADLTGANLQNAKLCGVNLTAAILKKANFAGAKFALASHATDLRGVDLSAAELGDANLQHCLYDEKTRLPKSITKAQLEKMTWFGGGTPPHLRKQNRQAAGPLDFDQFMKRLTEITDASRLQKALKMLKAEQFQLFSEVTEDSVYGVVRSQSDPSLVYSCSLTSQGEFACCTQNLNPCGGLRGALCKHILVLAVGLTKGGELNATEIDQWINDSQIKSPALDKDRMSEVLLKYKGAEAGEIDWRPTETVPEDFMAF